MKKIIVFLLMLVIVPAFAVNHYPKSSNVPGGIIVKNIPCRYRAYFHKTRLLVLRKNKRCTAIIGVPLKTKPGIHKATLKSKHGKKTISFRIKAKKYPAQYIKLKYKKYKKMVIPDKKTLKRIIQDQKTTKESFNHWKYRRHINMHFNWPVRGRISGKFGLQRYYNGKKRSSHKGIDIAARRGTPIKAPASGVVISTGRLLLTGNTIFIDHGQRLVTVYCHLNKILVKPKQRVKRGQVIGLVGSTGRSTGPHLHWGVSLNNARVNPYLFLSSKSRKITKKRAK